MNPGTVSMKQQSREGMLIRIMISAHLPLILEVSSTLGPLIKVSRM